MQSNTPHTSVSRERLACEVSGSSIRTPSSPKEAFVTDRLMPQIMRIVRDCADNGISLLAVCEWAPETSVRTLTLQPETGLGLRLADAAVRSNGSVDSVINAIKHYATRHGHDSNLLETLGIPKTPVPFKRPAPCELHAEVA